MPIGRVLYPPERLAKLADDAAKAQSIFSLQDRMGLVDDTLALAKAGYCTVGDALSLIDVLRDEKDCKSCLGRNAYSSTYLLLVDVVWKAIGNNLSTLLSVWYEDPEIVSSVSQFSRVSQSSTTCSWRLA